MTNQILSYPPAAKPTLRGNVRRVWVIVTIYMLPILVPLGIWTGATWHQIVVHPANIAIPYYFALTAAAGPFGAGEPPESGFSRAWVAEPGSWTFRHPMGSSPIPPIVGACCLGCWLFVAMPSAVMRWPITAHLLLSAGWWSFGYVWVLSGCLQMLP